MAEIMIELKGLTKQYGDITAVNNLSLDVKRGEIFGLLGPNGAGKTTTTLMLLGLTEPSAGLATIAGVDCTRNPLQVKRFVGYLPDNMGFYADMTGRENLRMTGRMNGMNGVALEKRIDTLLKRIGMADAADRRTSTYSKGMKQRLGIADILIKDPDVLIMDEPTNGIDPEGMKHMMRLIRELAEEDGKTIMISSHQLHQIQQICDRVGIFVKGKLIACGRIDELAKQLEAENGYRFEIGAKPFTGELVSAIRNVEGAQTVDATEEYVIVQTEQNIISSIVDALVSAHFEVCHIRQISNDLDDIYSRYFEKAGEKHERSGSKSGHRR